MKSEEKIYVQHAEHVEWTSKLKFYADEILVLKSRLEELAAKNNDHEVMAQVEHFQNQFIVQKNNIDELKHAITVDEDHLKAEVNKNPVAVDHRKVPYHTEEKEAVEVFEKNFNQLRDEFKHFAAKWM